MHDPPDWTNWRSLLPLVLLVCILPPMLLSLVILIFSRHHYPIPGRGFSYLLGTCIAALITVLIYLLIGIYFPQGAPCGITVLSSLLDILIAAIFVIRGISLVFRLEIMNYLQEMRWKEEQKTDIEKRAMLTPRRPSDDAAAASTNITTIHVDPIASFTDSAKYASDGTLLGNGRYFIDHRRYTEPRRLFALIFGVYTCVVIGMVVLVLFDPDVDRTDALLREQGMLPPPPATSGPAFSHSFGTGALCIPFALKSLYSYLVMVAGLVPAGVFMAWRIHTSKRRNRRREQEKREWKVKLQLFDREQARADGDGDSDDTDKSAIATSEVKGDMVKRDSLTSLHRGSVSNFDLDDSQNVKREFILLCGVTFGVVVFLASDVVGWYPTALLKAFLAVWAWFLAIILPLRLSFNISERHRLFLIRGRMGMSMDDANGRSEASQHTLLPHLKPYYDLHFLLRSPHTYPVLLRYLEKEFSSENALFWTAAQEFTEFSRGLERSIPGWSLDRDCDKTVEAPVTGAAIDVNITIDMLRSTSAARTAKNAAIVITPEDSGNSSKRTGYTDMDSDTKRKGRNGSARTGTSPTDDAVSDGSVCPPPARSESPSSEIETISLSAPATEPSRPPIHHGSPAAALTPAVLLSPPTQSSGWLSVDGSMCVSVGNPSSGSHSGRSSGSDEIRPMMRARSFLTRTRSPSPQPIESRQQAWCRAEIEQFHADASRAKEWALRIHADYLDRSARFEVNVPALEAKQVAQQIELLRTWQPTPNKDRASNSSLNLAESDLHPPVPPPFPLSRLYGATSSSIFSLMEKDSVRRFRLTQEFQKLLEEADEEEMERVEKQQDLATNTREIIDKALSLQKGQQERTGTAMSSHRSGQLPGTPVTANHSPHHRSISVEPAHLRSNSPAPLPFMLNHPSNLASSAATTTDRDRDRGQPSLVRLATFNNFLGGHGGGRNKNPPHKKAPMLRTATFRG